MAAPVRWTRGRQNQVIAERLDTSVLDGEQRALLTPLIFDQICRPDMTKSELIRFIFLTPELSPYRKLSNTDLAKFLRCSEGNVSRVLSNLEAAARPTITLTPGRPTVLRRESEQLITDWLRQRVEMKDWPTLQVFKEKVCEQLDVDAPTFVPSHQFFYDLLSRLSDGEFTVRSASGLDELRYEVTPDMVCEYFECLNAIDLEAVDPRLIINVDETGFGQSLSGRSKPQKVIVPASFAGSPVYKSKEEKRYVSCIAATTLSGRLLTPGLVSVRQQEAADATKCSFYSHCVRYHSATAFVSTDIFHHYMRHVILDYVETIRTAIGEKRRCVIIFDGHKGHLSSLLNSLCAEQNIQIVVLPPHSSHLLQPLDQFIFKRMKRQFGQISQITSLTKSSGTLERVWSAYQASDVTWVIWRSWEQTGITPNVVDGLCESCSLNVDIVLDSTRLQHASTPNERSRGRPVNVGQFGLLNEDEFLILEAGQCPFCCQPLDDDFFNSKGATRE